MKKILIIVSIIICLVISMFVVKYCYNNFYIASIPEVTDVFLSEDNNVNIKYKLNGNSLRSDIYYIFKNNNIIPEVNDIEWKLSNSNEETICVSQ